MRKPDSKRIDYSPTQASIAAIEEVVQRDGLTKQAAIDKLIALGRHALELHNCFAKRPHFIGKNRKRWRV